tara:strand:+ start:456 stop:659 length:204 start_codon:yes stop_codon:yes gene_type:complete
MIISIKTAVQINTTKKDFLIYTLENNTIKQSIFTNDLYRHRRKFGINSRFILVDVLKKQTNNLTINL